LVVDEIEEQQDTAIVELFNPIYDLDKNSIKYQTTPDNATSIDLPSEFGQTTLLIHPDGQSGPGTSTLKVDTFLMYLLKKLFYNFCFKLIFIKINVLDRININDHRISTNKISGFEKTTGPLRVIPIAVLK